MHVFANSVTYVLTWIELPCAMLHGCVSHVHVQHCHAWPACVAIPCRVQLRGISVTKFSLSKQPLLNRVTYMYTYAQETLAAVN